MKNRQPLPEVADRDCNTDPHIADHSKTLDGGSFAVPEPTENEKPYSIKLDWLEFSFKDEKPELLVPLLLDLDFDEFHSESYSLQGFEHLWTFGPVKVLFSPNRENTPLKFILSSQALDVVGVDAMKIVKHASEFGCIWVRIDIAVDCKNELLDMALIEDSFFSGLVVHKFRQILPIKKYNSRMEVTGHSITLGSPAGKRMLCIYDKRLERICKGKDDPGHWIRLEGRWRSSTAKIVANTLLKTGLDAGYILGIIDFREKSQKHIDKRERCVWWETFLAGVEPIKTGERKIPTTIEKKVEWIAEKINTTIAQVFVDQGMDFIKEVIKSGIRKTKKDDWAKLFGPRMDIDYFSQLQSI